VLDTPVVRVRLHDIDTDAVCVVVQGHRNTLARACSVTFLIRLDGLMPRPKYILKCYLQPLVPFGY
jgi:hypothetical protein